MVMTMERNEEIIQVKPPKVEILAVIPARGGSRRLPGKNIKLLNGIPLIQYTIQQSLSSKLVTRTIVSTDDDAIREVSQMAGAEVINCPSYLHTGDELGTTNVTKHALEYLKRYKYYQPLIVVLLQPTSPLRTVEDIDNTIRLLIDSGAESAETMCNGKENGAVYVSRRQVFTEQNRILGDSVVYYEMPPERSVDINTQADFDLAESSLQGQSLIEPHHAPNHTRRRAKR